MKKEIIIPKGIKATMYQDEDRVVIEYEEKKESFKAGDVVESENAICLYHSTNVTGGIVAYFGYNKNINRFVAYEKPENGLGKTEDFHSASKASREKLFSEMVKAGYSWNAKRLEFKKKEPKFKDGDFITMTYSNSQKNIAIVRGKYINEKGKVGTYASKRVNDSYVSCSGNTFLGDECRFTRIDSHSTESEKQQLLNAMHENGKDWDAVNKKIIDYKWMPKEGDIFWTINSCRSNWIDGNEYHNTDYFNNIIKNGLYWQTEKEALEAVKKIKQ